MMGGNAQTANRSEKADSMKAPQRHRLPMTRNGLIHKFRIGNTKAYIRVGLYPDGSPGEVFLTVAKAGSTLQGLMDSFATLLSLSLQYGIPLAVIAKKFRHVRFPPNGFTGDKKIPTASSLIDYVFAFLEREFLKGETKAA